MNDNDAVPNPALRAHVSDHSFVLTLRKTHIAALSRIVNESGTMTDRAQADLKARRSTADTANLAYGVLSFFVPAVGGLITRGLIEHRMKPNFRGQMFGKRNDRLTDYYRLTRAGWAVYDLLSEAGLVEAVDRRSPRRRLVA